MKRIKQFEHFVNEAITWDVDTNEPHNDKKENAYARSFRIDFDPITVKGVEGQIDEDYTELEIDFSNGDKIYLVNDYRNNYKKFPFNKGESNCVITKSNDKSEVDVTIYWDRFMGSSGTVTGDLCILYKYYIEGKLK